MNTIPFFPARPDRLWPESALFTCLVADSTWACEPKLDGYRVCVIWTQTGVSAWTRHGKPQVLSSDVEARLRQVRAPVGTAVDGELLGPRQAGAPQRFVAFDLPIWAGVLDQKRTLDERRLALETLGLSLIERLPNEVASFERALTLGHEGIVLKRCDSLYPFMYGPADSTNLWLKVKAPTVDGRLIETDR